MATKKRFFKKKASVGNKSVKVREKVTSKAVIPDLIENQGSKTSKNPIKNREFPNIIRFITETSNRFKATFLKTVGIVFGGWGMKKAALVLGGMVLASILIGEAIQVFQSGSKYASILQQRALLQTELRLWEDIATKYPNYRDAEFQVAMLAYQLGDREVENEYLQKVLSIDPNYQPALDLEKRY